MNSVSKSADLLTELVSESDLVSKMADLLTEKTLVRVAAKPFRLASEPSALLYRILGSGTRPSRHSRGTVVNSVGAGFRRKLFPFRPGFEGWAETVADGEAHAAVEGDRSGPGLADMLRGDDVGAVDADEAV